MRNAGRVRREKNMRSVSPKPDVQAGTALASKRPRTGSRTNSRTATAVTIPTAPIVMKAYLQSNAAATEAPNAMPSAMPIGGPRL